MELSPGKFRAQMCKMESAARKVLTGIFGRELPPDRLLNDFFRENRNCGARDRKAIASGVYALLRYWGWLRKLPGEELTGEIEQGSVPLNSREMLALLAGGLYIEGKNGLLTERMFAELGLARLARNPEAYLRAGAFAKSINVMERFEYRELFPEKLIGEINPQLDQNQLFAMLAKRPPMWLRCRKNAVDKLLAELAANEIPATQIPGGDGSAVRVDNPGVSLFTLETFQNGDFEVQDLASQVIGLAAAPAPGERWYDACAGAGGKTLQLAELMSNRGTIVAGDIRISALENLKKRCRKAGYSNVTIRPHDGSPWKGKHPYDGVLLDCPCSGSGVWRRNPGCQWIMSAEKIAALTEKQRRILAGNAPAVKVGGVLIYATCSLFAAENLSVVEDFLAKNPGFALENFPHPLTGEDTGGMLQVDGGAFDCDWMFVARMRRNC